MSRDDQSKRVAGSSATLTCPVTAAADRDSGVVVRTLSAFARAVSELELLHGTVTVAMHLPGGPEFGNRTGPSR